VQCVRFPFYLLSLNVLLSNLVVLLFNKSIYLELFVGAGLRKTKMVSEPKI
jgi:hypothetical protein